MSTITPDTLFRRSWRVAVSDLDVSSLDIEFKILKTIKPEPNKCALTVWNLNQGHRADLLKRNNPFNLTSDKIVGIPVQIDAGYRGHSSTIFYGDLNQVSSINDATNWKTIIAGSDGGRSYREGRINRTFKKGTRIADVLSACADAMKIGRGNVDNFETLASIPSLGATIPHSMTMSGNAASQLTRVITSIGLTWSIQNGSLQVLGIGAPLDGLAIILDQNHGLIGSPESSIDSTVSLGNAQQYAQSAPLKVAKPPKPKDPGIIKVKSMIIPGLAPGRKLVVNSDQFHDFPCYITEIEYVGASFTNDWYCNLICRQY